MSVLWERLSGDTSVFAMKVAFHRDPHEGEAATPEESVSWGSFQIRVKGESLCSHRESGELVLQSVHPAGGASPVGVAGPELGCTVS
jgi:hypothetical protein